MTRTTNARLAGFAFLLYIVAGVAPMARPHGPLLDVVFSFAQCFSALVLAVTLYAITRDEDHDLAMLAMMCRIGEGVIGASFMSAGLALASLQTSVANGSNAE